MMLEGHSKDFLVLFIARNYHQPFISQDLASVGLVAPIPGLVGLCQVYTGSAQNDCALKKWTVKPAEQTPANSGNLDGESSKPQKIGW